MVTRVLALVLLLGAAVSAQTSQPPTPGIRAAARKQPQPEAARADQQPPNDPRGTHETPLVVQVQPTAKTDKEASEEQAQEHEKASEKWWAFAFGIATGVVGLLQVFAIGFQVYIARGQNKIIEKQSAIMDGQRIAAEVQSGHMLEGLASSKLSAEAARDAVLLTHRPRVTVRAVSAEFPLNSIHGGYVRIVNVGTSTATLKGLSERWLVVERLPMSNPLDIEQSHGVKDYKLPPGHFLLCELPDATLNTGDYIHFTDETDQWSLFLIGVVKYVDEKGYWRRTGFCRRYDRSLQRFVVIEHPDYEYEE